MQHRIVAVAAGLCVVGIALMLSAVPAQALPPKGKHYAAVMLFKNPMTGEVEMSLGCLSFKKKRACTDDGECGTWEWIEGSGRKGISAEMMLLMEAEGETFEVPAVGSGWVETRGDGSSIGGTMLVDFFGLPTNGSMAGIQLRKRACLDFGQLDEDIE